MMIRPQDWIPHRAPFLFVDEVVSIESQTITARTKFDASMDIYRGHYPHNPVTPGVLLCEAMFQTAGILVAFNLKHSQSKDVSESQGIPVLSRIEVAKFHAPILPDETVEMRITWEQTIGHFFYFEGRMTCQGRRILNMRFILALLAKDDVEDALTKSQYAMAPS
ncbi:MAG: hypothetical protein LBD40_03715 [Puniceicoccales bacterium]|jgi:3-hydroxyacyl-[acyl-carrier-protein] dehydratase|nr:hypothetical protein [Puniceicoccales bacterium]